MNIKDGDQIVVRSGRHTGRSGKVQDMKTSKSGAVTITVVQDSGNRFKTLAKSVELAGK